MFYEWIKIVFWLGPILHVSTLDICCHGGGTGSSHGPLDLELLEQQVRIKIVSVKNHLFLFFS